MAKWLKESNSLVWARIFQSSSVGKWFIGRICIFLNQGFVASRRERCRFVLSTREKGVKIHLFSLINSILSRYQGNWKGETVQFAPGIGNKPFRGFYDVRMMSVWWSSPTDWTMSLFTLWSGVHSKSCHLEQGSESLYISDFITPFLYKYTSWLHPPDSTLLIIPAHDLNHGFRYWKSLFFTVFLWQRLHGNSHSCNWVRLKSFLHCPNHIAYDYRFFQWTNYWQNSDIRAKSRQCVLECREQKHSTDWGYSEVYPKKVRRKWRSYLRLEMGERRRMERESSISIPSISLQNRVHPMSSQMSSRKTNELVATLRPHYVLGQEQHTLLLSIAQSHLKLQEEIVLTILYLEQYRRKRWDVRRSYRDDFLLAVTLA